MSEGTYVLVRFSAPERLLPAISVIAHSPTVLRWNAVEGHTNLVLRLAPGVHTLPVEIKNLQGLQDVQAYGIVSNDEDGVLFDPQLCYAYVFLETDPAKREPIRGQLRVLENVVFCSSITGGCDLIACVMGRSFPEIDRIVHEQIQNTTGILRLKVERIINLTTMS